ncbi:phosphoribosylformylglycinamidine synthase subunit PurS [Ruficoccus sp. ZRK36]|uniref:phosphoribosylformylglycinamidine synthase subunit PurS n=1 Tax=Ruficoccus sp. ZRK36 TaxID=2866311 RepID=UPI001C73B68B|nr:phosphoribosylformylglycinamidine synthase subunit PurS [Ruficoccus sp. ZRK36]QYY36298.1 phosphoribosylformylglycinamidine synthase subunit PurS [Ruficoccus sp. ZRK36]
MKVIVFVTPKKNVLDPQGAAVGHAMHSLGFTSAANVRVGKTVEFEVDGQDTPEFRATLDKLCNDLLSNPVIEDFRYELEA